MAKRGRKRRKRIQLCVGNHQSGQIGDLRVTNILSPHYAEISVHGLELEDVPQKPTMLADNARWGGDGRELPEAPYRALYKLGEDRFLLVTTEDNKGQLIDTLEARRRYNKMSQTYVNTQAAFLPMRYLRKIQMDRAYKVARMRIEDAAYVREMQMARNPLARGYI